jgi:hypothetical protein
MNEMLNNNWKDFKAELHAAIKKHEARAVEICSGAYICAMVDGNEVTQRYDSRILTAEEIKAWRDTLSLR